MGAIGNVGVADGPGAAAAPPGVCAAFFDVDNTIVRGAALYPLAIGLWRKKLLTTRSLGRATLHQLQFRIRGAENSAHVEQAKAGGLALIRGFRVADLEEIVEGIVDGMLAEGLWPGTVDLAREHIAAGQPVWLVTAAPVELARTLARRLGLTGALGTVADSVDGVYSGQMHGEVLRGPAKADAVRALAEHEGYDLAACAAYSDSAHDFPLLELVGRPCAINPDRHLRERAEARGWALHDYRRGRHAATVLARVAPAVLGAAAATAITRAVLRRR
jgi:HAD superfamily hydrolase (TIGR01490 family)